MTLSLRQQQAAAAAMCRPSKFRIQIRTQASRSPKSCKWGLSRSCMMTSSAIWSTCMTLPRFTRKKNRSRCKTQLSKQMRASLRKLLSHKRQSWSWRDSSLRTVLMRARKRRSKLFCSVHVWCSSWSWTSRSTRCSNLMISLQMRLISTL